MSNLTSTLKQCVFCKKDFSIPTHALKRGRGKFCSKLCCDKEKVGKPAWNKGTKFTEEHIEKLRISAKKRLLKKENHPRWIKDRSLLKCDQQRNNSMYKDWRKQVWERDSYKCRIADDKCNGRIEAHHILRWIEYPELRYKINNGITLCHAHHPRVRAEEKRLIPTFQELVSVSSK